jgi:hypothetical protein
MNLVYSAAIKQYLSEPNPPVDEDTFLNELTAMMLGYLAYQGTSTRS